MSEDWKEGLSYWRVLILVRRGPGGEPELSTTVTLRGRTGRKRLLDLARSLARKPPPEGGAHVLVSCREVAAADGRVECSYVRCNYVWRTVPNQAT